MSDSMQAQSKTNSWPITIGAEGIAAAQFARCGFDVLVQAGRDKPWYDMMVTKSGNILKVSIKASDNGRWSLTHGFSRRSTDWGAGPAEHRNAVEMWLNQHGSRAVCCLVQFDGVEISQLPRVYLASPLELARKMMETVDRLGHATLYEQYAWTSAEEGTENLEMLPIEWRFSPERIQELLNNDGLSTPGTASLLRMAPQVPGPSAVRPDGPVALTA